MKFQVGDVLVLRTLPYGWYYNYIDNTHRRKCEVIKIENGEDEQFTRIYLSTEFGNEYFSLREINKMLLEYIPTSLENV